MDKVSYYARARKVAVGRITQLVGGNFRSYWVGKLRGMIVSRDDGEYRFETEEDARAAAEQFLARCRAALKLRESTND